MKTSIIHVLILAIVLVVGWSLFTVLQDIYSTDSQHKASYGLMSKGRQYLPLTPKGYSQLQKYPTYKVPSHVKDKMDQEISTPRNVTYRAKDNSLIGGVNYNRGSIPTTSHSVSATLKSIERLPSTINQNRSMAMAMSDNNIVENDFTSDNRMIRTYRNAVGDNTQERGRKIGRNSEHSIPVGDGLYLLLLMAGVYAIFKTRLK